MREVSLVVSASDMVRNQSLANGRVSAHAVLFGDLHENELFAEMRHCENAIVSTETQSHFSAT